MESYPFSSVTSISVQSLADDAKEIDSLRHNLADLVRWRDAGLPVPRAYENRVRRALNRAEADLSAIASGAHQLHYSSMVFDEALKSVGVAKERNILSEVGSERVREMLLLQGELETAVVYLRWIVQMLRPLIPLGDKAKRWLTTDRSRLRELPPRRRQVFYISLGVLAYSVASWVATIFVAWYPQTTPFFPPGFLLLVSTPHGAQALPGILPYDVGTSGLVEAVVLLGAEMAFVAHFIDVLLKLHRIEVDFDRRWQDERHRVELNEERLFHGFFSKEVLQRSRSLPDLGPGDSPGSGWW
jgi:hypothetical protein